MTSDPGLPGTLPVLKLKIPSPEKSSLLGKLRPLVTLLLANDQVSWFRVV